MTKSEIRDKQICLLSIITGLPLSGLPNYKFGFRSSAQKNGPPGEGRNEGLVPRNDVLTSGFIRASGLGLRGRFVNSKSELSIDVVHEQHNL